MTGPSHPPFGAFDLIDLGVLEAGWDEKILRVARHNARRTVLDGASVTSRESDPSVQIEVAVVSGNVVQKELPWLFSLYETTLCDLATKIAGYRTCPAIDVVSAVNINVISGVGGRYEWHVDNNPLTGLLFVNTLASTDGGEVLFRGGGTERMVAPKAGLFLAFDARTVPHTVLPLKKSIERVSVPMNFYASPVHQTRPDDLNRYLYRDEAA